jgi:hypothetical protein
LVAERDLVAEDIVGRGYLLYVVRIKSMSKKLDMTEKGRWTLSFECSLLSSPDVFGSGCVGTSWSREGKSRKSGKK